MIAHGVNVDASRKRHAINPCVITPNVTIFIAIIHAAIRVDDPPVTLAILAPEQRLPRRAWAILLHVNACVPYIATTLAPERNTSDDTD